MLVVMESQSSLKASWLVPEGNFAPDHCTVLRLLFNT
jgi:hypothetical protein